MKAHMPYDCSGLDGKSNVSAWKKLPPSLAFAIRTYQNRIEEEIQSKNPGKFRVTSGFRGEITNRRHSSVVDSGHRLGYCRDYVPVSCDFSDVPVVDTTRFAVSRSERCWHVRVII